MNLNLRKLIYSILIPLLLGSLVGLITASNNNYNMMIRPSFAPPGFIFPIVWTILYILMGISSYLINESNNINTSEAIKIYIIQLILNLLWSFIFFKFELYFLAFIWIIVLIIFVIIMIIRFYKVSKLSAYLQIPYLLWLLFALILNFNIFLLN